MDEHTIGRFKYRIRASEEPSRSRQAERDTDDSKQSVIADSQHCGVQRAFGGAS